MNCCEPTGKCTQAHGCPVRCTPLNQLGCVEHIDLTGLDAGELPQPTFLGEEPEHNAPYDTLDSWMTALRFWLPLILAIASTLLLIGTGHIPLFTTN